MSDIHFTLYTRSYCHLCEDMLQALQQLHGMQPYLIKQVDVDADPALIKLYDELVPVLIGRKGDQLPVQLCNYFLDVGKVQAFLQGE
ncbi:glutaredoxin family protein [Glaciimonas soli]|uniref:Glutaredoxin family protein n=1 Tax=Glaciimonas soli TaxID=2590999 RepID=A0A843YVH1_9BURK|nr:glutaredoxin family protein [Glaciimonas soli]MQR01694.1 glutaredoxin family protein [Glaciimonas soli]